MLQPLTSFSALSEQSEIYTSVAGLKDSSALFRHEVAYCLGQRQDAAAIDTLKEVLADSHEHCMSVLSHAVLSQLQAANYPLILNAVNRVRHEAGEALGAIGTATCLKELQQYLQDPCLEVRLHSTSVRMFVEPA